MVSHNETATLEKAAKYICTFMDGMCPMAVEDYLCPQECTINTVPWRCWISYFQEQRRNSEPRPRTFGPKLRGKGKPAGVGISNR